jgi:hypothetical protein
LFKPTEAVGSNRTKRTTFWFTRDNVTQSSCEANLRKNWRNTARIITTFNWKISKILLPRVVEDHLEVTVVHLPAQADSARPVLATERIKAVKAVKPTSATFNENSNSTPNSVRTRSDNVELSLRSAADLDLADKVPVLHPHLLTADLAATLLPALLSMLPPLQRILIVRQRQLLFPAVIMRLHQLLFPETTTTIHREGMDHLEGMDLEEHRPQGEIPLELADLEVTLAVPVGQEQPEDQVVRAVQEAQVAPEVQAAPEVLEQHRQRPTACSLTQTTEIPQVTSSLRRRIMKRTQCLL